MKIITTLTHLFHTLFVQVLSSLQSAFLLAVRLYWGWQFAETGWGKLQNLEKVTEFFTSLNIPLPHLNAIMAGSTEFFGGLLLIVGLGSRFASVALTFTMAVAYLTADREALVQVFSNPEAFYQAAPFTFLMAAMIIAIFGPGKASLDACCVWFFGNGRDKRLSQKSATIYPSYSQPDNPHEI